MPLLWTVKHLILLKCGKECHGDGTKEQFRNDTSARYRVGQKLAQVQIAVSMQQFKMK